MNWVPVILVCWVLACFVFVVWFCVLFGFVLCVFAVCLVYDDDGPMDYVQVLPQFSFAALNSRWPGTLICNYCSCNVIQCGKRPGESHEGCKCHSSWPVLLSPSCPCCLSGRPLSFPCWPPPAAFPLVLFRSLASFAVLAAVVFFGLLFGAPLRRPFVVLVWVLVCFLVCSGLPCLLSFCLVWWAVFALAH